MTPTEAGPVVICEAGAVEAIGEPMIVINGELPIIFEPGEIAGCDGEFACCCE